MAITAAMVKELRERTGAGMMECKKALTETGGDLEAAIEAMRKSGMAKADKKAGRTAAEGLIVVAGDAKRLAMVEVNCETDFVAKGDEFRDFATAVAARALANSPADVEALLAMPLEDGGALTIQERCRELIAKIGENMGVRRFELVEAASGLVASYLHGTRIGVAVEMEGGSTELARDIAMHVAASRPICVDESEVPAETIEKEREIYTAQAAESGKPAEIVAKMVEGRVKKYLKEVTLLGQPFVKNPDQSVEQLLKEQKATVRRFFRYEVGEGVEKKAGNFADEVAAMARGE